MFANYRWHVALTGAKLHAVSHFDLQMECTHDPFPLTPLLTTQVTNNLSSGFFRTPRGIDGCVCSRRPVKTARCKSVSKQRRTSHVPHDALCLMTGPPVNTDWWLWGEVPTRRYMLTQFQITTHLSHSLHTTLFSPPSHPF